MLVHLFGSVIHCPVCVEVVRLIFYHFLLLSTNCTTRIKFQSNIAFPSFIPGYHLTGLGASSVCALFCPCDVCPQDVFCPCGDVRLLRILASSGKWLTALLTTRTARLQVIIVEGAGCDLWVLISFALVMVMVMAMFGYFIL